MDPVTDTLTSIALTAFLIGALSAVSLPLGAATARAWVPQDRVIAGLMSFGGGALLAALTIDLVAPVVEEGHFVPLLAGSVAGGLLFVILNQAVNDYGGFVRKVSTTVYHLRRKQHHRYRKIFKGLNRLDIFRNLADRDFKALASYLETHRYPEGSAIYQLGDPPQGLYIIAEGEVELLNPVDKATGIERLQRGDSFSRFSFLTGAPRSTLARAATDVELWFLPRSRFEYLIAASPELNQAVHKWLRSHEVEQYLATRHGLDAAQIDAWVHRAAVSLINRGVIPSSVQMPRRQQEFMRACRDTTRFDLVNNLPAEELQRLGDRVIYKRFRKGQALFHRGDVSDRLYILDDGDISLLDPGHTESRPLVLGPYTAFGVLSCLSGARHKRTAVVAEDAAVWELLRSDVEKLYMEAPGFAERLKQYLVQREITDYLEKRQGLNSDKARRWVSEAVRAISSRQRLPAVADWTQEIKEQKGAAMAIWLGILLDGVPESLVIGAIVAHSNLSLSLIAGVFLANYPEALSSSIGMKHQGLSFQRIMSMWLSLVLLTGLGAAIGSVFFANASPGAFSVIEGVAAGAMLTMIAQTMLPEAYMKGGNVVGLTTLAGFLTAVFFKAIS